MPANRRSPFEGMLTAKDAPLSMDNTTDNVSTNAPVKRRKSDGMRQVGFRMPGDVYSDFVAWCHANEYAVGPTAGAALREYMARHGEG